MSSQSPVAPVVVTLAGQSYTLPRPPSFLVTEALDTEFRRVASSTEERDDPIFGCIVWAALVGAYLPQLLPPTLTLKAYRWNAKAFGEAVYEHLRENGCTTSEIVSAGLECLKENRRFLAPREHEVAEETGNS